MTIEGFFIATRILFLDEFGAADFINVVIVKAVDNVFNVPEVFGKKIPLKLGGIKFFIAVFVYTLNGFPLTARQFQISRRLLSLNPVESPPSRILFQAAYS